MVLAVQEGTADDLAAAIDTFEYVDAARLHIITSALGKRYRTLVQVFTVMLNMYLLHPTNMSSQHLLVTCASPACGYLVVSTAQHASPVTPLIPSTEGNSPPGCQGANARP